MNVDYDRIGKHLWSTRSLGVKHPVPVLAVAARRNAKLTQPELADALGIGRSTLAKIERGYVPMPPSLLPLWADACGTVHELLDADLSPIECAD